MELGARHARDPGLHAEVAVPCDAFKKRIDEADDRGRCNQLRPKARTLGNASRNNGRNGRSKSEQKEKAHQIESTLLRQLLGTHEEVRAIGDAIADQEIHHGGDRKIHQDLHQGIHLVLLAHRAQFQKGKAGVHGEHHDGAKQEKKGVGALVAGVHGVLRCGKCGNGALAKAPCTLLSKKCASLEQVQRAGAAPQLPTNAPPPCADARRWCNSRGANRGAAQAWRLAALRCKSAETKKARHQRA